MGSCEDGDETSVSIESAEFIEELNDFAPWSWERQRSVFLRYSAWSPVGTLLWRHCISVVKMRLLAPHLFPGSYVRNNIRSAEWIFVKIYVGEFYWNLSTHARFVYNLIAITDIWHLYEFLRTSRAKSLNKHWGEICFEQKLYRRIKYEFCISYRFYPNFMVFVVITQQWANAPITLWLHFLACISS
jgi:hypothetical protein